MPKFTETEYREILLARARLEAYRLKIQPYPSYPQRDEVKPQLVEHIVRHSDMGTKEFDLLQQTARQLNYVGKKLTEHTEYKKKPQLGKSASKGIKIE